MSHPTGIFGLHTSEAEAQVLYLPVPWDATTSYGKGAALGPRAILRASHQIDLWDSQLGAVHQAGLHLLEEDQAVWNLNKQGREAYQHGDSEALNPLSGKLNDWVYDQTLARIREGKVLGVVGGDHSCPLGAFRAAGEVFGEFGILHFDAHMDLRAGYEDYRYSHASIMYNALEEVPQLNSLVQVGIRDFCEEELRYGESKGVHCHTNAKIKDRLYQGESFQILTDDFLKPLPKKVWVSFDVDGLDPSFCPNTGTPVPGGLDFDQAVHVLKTLAQSGRTIVGFDLCEVAPSPEIIDRLVNPKLNFHETGSEHSRDEWDGNVGMRLLYQLTGWTLASQS